MEAVLQRFLTQLKNLRILIDFYESEHDLLSIAEKDLIDNTSFQKLSKKYLEIHVSKRRFNYNTVVITLYGAFERFIEEVIVAYLEHICQIVSDYSKLPETLTKSHLKFSLELLKKVEENRYSGALRKEEIIKNLHDCINTKTAYRLNKEAFVMHSANFRNQVIEQAFNSLDVQTLNHKILKKSNFKEFFLEKNNIEELVESSYEQAFNLIDDLADRRNEVAHGLPCDILQNQLLLDYIELFEKYSNGLVEVLSNELLLHEIGQRGQPLGKITNIYQSGKVICLKTNNVVLNVGSIIIGKHESDTVKYRIVEMMLDDKEITSISEVDNYEIGIKLNKKFKKKSQLFILV